MAAGKAFTEPPNLPAHAPGPHSIRRSGSGLTPPNGAITFKLWGRALPNDHLSQATVVFIFLL